VVDEISHSTETAMTARLTNASEVRYNNLPFVGAADEYVENGGLAEKMALRVREIFLRHELADYWGISLLHRHWPIESDEVPAEDAIFDKGLPAYVMRPALRNSGDIYVPCLISIEDASFETLEFSSRPDALNAFHQLQQRDVFLQELREALLPDGLNQVFGLGSVRQVSDERNRLVEFSYGDRAPVMRETPFSQIADSDLIQTFWTFSAHMVQDQLCESIR
jgi:hypothetical protein